MRIEKNIPIPEMQYRKKRLNKYPFSQMELGDSFMVEHSHEDFDKTKRTVYSSMHQYIMRKNKECKFCIRQVEGGLRVWRIK